MSKTIRFLQFKCNNKKYSTLVQKRLFEFGIRWYASIMESPFSTSPINLHIPYIHVNIIDKTMLVGVGEINTSFTKSLTLIDLYTKEGIELITQ